MLAALSPASCFAARSLDSRLGLRLLSVPINTTVLGSVGSTETLLCCYASGSVFGFSLFQNSGERWQPAVTLFCLRGGYAVMLAARSPVSRF
jgi:hypothetical protein